MPSRSVDYRRRRKAEVLRRVKLVDLDALASCVVPGCGRPTQARAGNGLSPTLCRYHIQYKARHGSAWHGTYKVSWLRPYYISAQAWLKENAKNSYVLWALIDIENLLAHSGPIPRVVDLPWMLSEEKACAALARLGRADVSPSRLLAIHLGISAAIEEDPYGPHGDLGEFRRVQVAKAIHRLASGYHADYGSLGSRHKYPRSSGQMLRSLGTMIEKASELVASYHLSNVLDLKIERYGALPPATGKHRYPRSRFGNSLIAPRPPSVSSWLTDRSERVDTGEASSRLTRQLHDRFRHDGFKAFDGKF